MIGNLIKPDHGSVVATKSVGSNTESNKISDSRTPKSIISKPTSIQSMSSPPHSSSSASSPNVSVKQHGDYFTIPSKSVSSSHGSWPARSSSQCTPPDQYSSNETINSNFSSNDHLSTYSDIQSYIDDEVQTLPPGVPRGLSNLGNTCYMNAALQSLYSLQPFRDFILRTSHDKVLCNELSDLFKEMKNSSSSVSPANFKYAFSRYQNRFSGVNQHDSQEFLRFLIEGIHEECNLASKRTRRSVPPRSPVTADEAWNQYRDIVDDSPLVDMAVGQLCSTICCSVCQNKSRCWDPFWDLSLPMMRGKYSCKLSEIIDNFTSKEVLDLDDKPICTRCKCPTRSTKQISFHRLPKLLILHLKRFSNDGYKLTNPEVKIEKQVTIDSKTYQLHACISHHGHSCSSGHYTALCKYQSKWFHFNDDRVRDVTDSFDSDSLSEAYLLFYLAQDRLAPTYGHSKL